MNMYQTLVFTGIPYDKEDAGVYIRTKLIQRKH